MSEMQESDAKRLAALLDHPDWALVMDLARSHIHHLTERGLGGTLSRSESARDELLAAQAIKDFVELVHQAGQRPRQFNWKAEFQRVERENLTTKPKIEELRPPA